MEVLFVGSASGPAEKDIPEDVIILRDGLAPIEHAGVLRLFLRLEYDKTPHAFCITPKGMRGLATIPDLPTVEQVMEVFELIPSEGVTDENREQVGKALEKYCHYTSWFPGVAGKWT